MGGFNGIVFNGFFVAWDIVWLAVHLSAGATGLVVFFAVFLVIQSVLLALSVDRYVTGF